LEQALKFIATDLEGAFVIEPEPLADSRGYFARLWCQDEFRQHGITMNPVQASVSHNALAGTLRGMHFQWPPSQEAKLIRCGRGSVYDVILDLRPDSATFTRHIAIELNSEKHNALYVPPGFAHGFQTLQDNSDIIYMMSDHYRPELAAGVRYNDSQFDIAWPLPISCMLERDRDYPDFDVDDYANRYSRALNSIGSGD